MIHITYIIIVLMLKQLTDLNIFCNLNMLISSDQMIMKINIIFFTALLWLPIQGKCKKLLYLFLYHNLIRTNTEYIICTQIKLESYMYLIKLRVLSSETQQFIVVIISGVIIGEVDGEIKPVSVSMTKEASSRYVATNAIDRNTGTTAWSQGSDSWFKSKLDRQYCIEEVRHWISNTLKTHTCSRDACTCSGSRTYCSKWPVSIYSEDGTAPDNVASDCMIGDTVKFDGSFDGYTYLSELVIIGRGKSLYHWLIIMVFFYSLLIFTQKLLFLKNTIMEHYILIHKLINGLLCIKNNPCDVIITVLIIVKPL